MFDKSFFKFMGSFVGIIAIALVVLGVLSYYSVNISGAAAAVGNFFK